MNVQESGEGRAISASDDIRYLQRNTTTNVVEMTRLLDRAAAVFGSSRSRVKPRREESIKTSSLGHTMGRGRERRCFHGTREDHTRRGGGGQPRHLPPAGTRRHPANPHALSSPTEEPVNAPVLASSQTPFSLCFRPPPHAPLETSCSTGGELVVRGGVMRLGYDATTAASSNRS
ncbi:hypothetical protein HPB50_022457 [Hyalomma asiaticum]|uniref:Uncharacterized protein n=1 Tax=Hyalomma asiaticum TaxID=266040 RepID=A0ACB7TPR6_HYAAI|nr:hypothetical protein HPB50_022457 [Hyalomma asiaticum]